MSRYGNVKAGAYTKMNLDSSSDTDLENLNDIEKVLGKIGISIRSTNTEFRSFSDVLEELSDKWINLDTVSKNAIATAMAGVRQREQFLVLMENMERVEELEQVSSNSKGTAEQKYTAYMETIENARNRLSNAWSEMAQRLEESGIVKVFTDVAVLITQHLLPALNAFVSGLISYNGFKIPTLIGNVGKKMRDLTPRFGKRRDDMYQQMIDWQDQNKLVKDPITGEYHTKKTGFLERYVDKQLGDDFAQGSNSLSAFSAAVDKATGSVADLVGQNQKDIKVSEKREQAAKQEAEAYDQSAQANLAATQSEVEETVANRQSAQSEYQDAQANLDDAKTEHINAQANLDDAKTELQGARNKLSSGLKSGASSAVKGAIAGVGISALTSGVTTGMSTEGSTKAKAWTGTASGLTTAAAGGIGFALGGPVGAAIGTSLGSLFGSVIAPKIAEIVDAEENARKDRIETATKLLETLKSQEKSLENLYSVSKQDNLLSDDIKSIRENVQAIKDADKDSGAFKDAFEAIIGQNEYSDLITATGSSSAADLYLNLDSILADESISSEIRSRLAKVAQMARIDAEDAAFMASKEGSSLTAEEKKERLNRKLQKAYLESGISDESSLSLARRGVADVERGIADKAGVELTTEVKRLIQFLMKHDDSTSVQSLLAGSHFTLSDIVNNTYGLSEEVQNDLLKQAALALGMTIDEVKKKVDDFGLLTIGDLNSSISDLSESLKSLTSYFDELMSTGTLSVEFLRDIIEKNGAEATAIGQGNLSLIIAATEQKYRQQGGTLLKEWTSGTASGAKIYEDLLNDPSMKNKNIQIDDSMLTALDVLDKLGFNQDSTSLDSLFKALNTSGFGDLDKETQDKIWDLYFNTYKQAAENIGNVTTAKYSKEVVQSAQQAIDRSLERQQNALEEQKSALEQINKQREYENKLIEAKIKLENAQNEKKKVWREGVGWVYEADTAAIADAQKELEELDNEKKVNELQVMIDELQAQRDWMSNLTESKEFEKAQKFMQEWAGNADSTMGVLKYWEKMVQNPPTFDVLEDNDEFKQQKIKAETYKNAQTVESLKQAYTDLTATKGGQLLLNGGSLADLGKMGLDDIDDFNAARGKFESAYKNASSYLDNDTVRQLTGLSQGKVDGYRGMFEQVNESEGGVGNITSGVGTSTAHLSKTPGGLDAQSFQMGQKIGEEWQVTGNPKDLHNNDERSWEGGKLSSAKSSIFYWSGDKNKWLLLSTASENPKSYSEMLNTPGLQGRFFTEYGEIYYLGKDGVMYAVEKASSHASGTLSTTDGLSMVNDDPQYGLEGIITPNGTLTALPSKSGVVPADMTRNVWQLGEVAPNLVKQLVDINGKFNSPLELGTDESFNVEHLDVHMVAQPGFDMDDFVRQLQAARNLTRHS